MTFRTAPKQGLAITGLLLCGLAAPTALGFVALGPAELSALPGLFSQAGLLLILIGLVRIPNPVPPNSSVWIELVWSVPLVAALLITNRLLIDNVDQGWFPLGTTMILYVLVQSCFEEVFFRAWIMSFIVSKSGPVTGIVISSAMFGVAHGVSIEKVVLATSFGVVLGLAFVIRGSLLQVVVAHASYNMVARYMY